MRNTKDAAEILGHEMGADAEYRRMVAEEAMNIKVAQSIYKLREEAGLTQKQLAALVGTTQPVISRLEDADYRGHSLSMLTRIAVALGKELNIGFSDCSSSTKTHTAIHRSADRAIKKDPKIPIAP